MTEIFHEMITYEVHIKEIFCCNCYFDEIYFFLQKEKSYEFFAKNFSEEHNCYFDSVFASLIIVCHYFLRFSKKKKYNLSQSMCIETVLSEDIHLCSI